MGLLVLLLFTGSTVIGQAKKPSIFGPRVLKPVYTALGAKRNVDVEKGYIVTKSGDTLSGYIDMYKFDISGDLHQVGILPFGKLDRSDVRRVPLDSIDYIGLVPTGTKYSGVIGFMPVDGSMWSLLGKSPLVRICGRNSIVTDFENGYEYVQQHTVVMFADSERVNIPVATASSIRSNLYFYSTFILQRYGVKYSRRELRHKDPIKVIPDRETRRLHTRMAKTS